MRLVAIALAISAIALVGCPSAVAPEGMHEEACARDCQARAKSCDEVACDRGCRFVIDRLVEHQGKNVVSCVAKASACDDPVWADCAAKIGPHLDGGPPAPPPKPSPDDDDDSE